MVLRTHLVAVAPAKLRSRGKSPVGVDVARLDELSEQVVTHPFAHARTPFLA